MKAKIREALEGSTEYKMSLAADVAEVWRQGKQGAYRIALDLPENKITGLIKHAKLKLVERPVVEAGS